DGYIDIKAVTKQIVSDPIKAKILINENGLLSDDEKTYYSKKVDDIVSQNDPRIKASQPALKEIDKANF
ncbi:MAG: hypothetical protein ABSC57_07980, partial [Syntrophales bacterium]